MKIPSTDHSLRVGLEAKGGAPKPRLTFEFMDGENAVFITIQDAGTGDHSRTVVPYAEDPRLVSGDHAAFLVEHLTQDGKELESLRAMILGFDFVSLDAAQMKAFIPVVVSVPWWMKAFTYAPGSGLVHCIKWCTRF